MGFVLVFGDERIFQVAFEYRCSGESRFKKASEIANAAP